MIAPSAVQRAKVDHRNMRWLGVTTLFSSSWLFKGIFSFEKYEKLRNILEISFLFSRAVKSSFLGLAILSEKMNQVYRTCFNSERFSLKFYIN